MINKSLDFWSVNWEDKYINWLDDKDIEITGRTETQYISIRDAIKMQFEASPFWVELKNKLGEFQFDYKSKNKNYNLLMHLEPPKVKEKSYESFFLKTFRKNILENEDPFNEPNDGWIFPDNWYSKIKDVVRTCFTVKYLDGAEYLANKIQSVCNEQNIEYVTSFEAKEEGYYAVHMSVLQEFDITDQTGVQRKIKVWIEIQITTQLQEVIRQLLHNHYEENREKSVQEDVKWQWNYKSSEFAANYLGHILHYVEGMIVEIRDKNEVIK